MLLIIYIEIKMEYSSDEEKISQSDDENFVEVLSNCNINFRIK